MSVSTHPVSDVRELYAPDNDPFELYHLRLRAGLWLAKGDGGAAGYVSRRPYVSGCASGPLRLAPDDALGGQAYFSWLVNDQEGDAPDAYYRVDETTLREYPELEPYVVRVAPDGRRKTVAAIHVRDVVVVRWTPEIPE